MLIKDTMIKRDVFEILEKELKNNKITAITGARQIGKSTAMKYIFEKVKNYSRFITFDDVAIKNLFEQNPQLFIEQNVKPYKYLFIDEFQYAKEGGKTLKFIHDTSKIKIFISGSSKPEISIQSLQYLVGRVSLIEMHPLTFKEFVNYKSKEKLVLLNKIRKITELEQLKAEFEEYLMFGGYPDVLLEKNFENKKKLLSDIIGVYLLKEIKDVLKYKESYDFEKLLKLIAVNNGKILKISDLSSDLGINWNKLQEYLTVLTKTNVLIQVNPFHSNKSKEITKSSKYYFHDLGFVNALLNNYSRLELRVDKGEILESFILHELQKQGFACRFWNKQQSKVDFVLEQDGKIVAIECKSNEKNMPKSLKYFELEYSQTKSFVFNLTNDSIRQNVLFLHYMNVSGVDYFS